MQMNRTPHAKLGALLYNAFNNSGLELFTQNGTEWSQLRWKQHFTESVFYLFYEDG